jgi:hypothetical protein
MIAVYPDIVILINFMEEFLRLMKPLWGMEHEPPSIGE